MTYSAPTLVDYGTLLELTANIGLFGPEDGASKALAQHHGLTPVSVPAGP